MHAWFPGAFMGSGALKRGRTGRVGSNAEIVVAELCGELVVESPGGPHSESRGVLHRIFGDR